MFSVDLKFYLKQWKTLTKLSFFLNTKLVSKRKGPLFLKLNRSTQFSGNLLTGNCASFVRLSTGKTPRGAQNFGRKRTTTVMAEVCTVE